MKISVVIPAYNEARRILPSLERIFAYMGSRHPDFEVLIVDDGSTDSTRMVVSEQFGHRRELRLLGYETNRGKGYAVRQGVLAANGEAVLVTDADLSTPIEELEKLLPWLEQGFDLVIGSRAHSQSEVQRRQNFLRERAGKLFNLFVRAVVRLPFYDTQCGFKLLRNGSMRGVVEALEIDRFAFDVELIALALAQGLRVVDVPVVWVNSPESTVSFWRGAEAYTELWAIRRRVKRLRSARATA